MTTETTSAVLRIGAIVPRTQAEGPGTRFAVWAQGCSIRCPGCFNPHFWGARGGRALTPADLAAQALDAAAGDAALAGVTLLGGEPFEQAEAFADFASGVRAAGLTVMVFTGFEREYLESAGAPPGSSALLAATDLLVDGPYLADRPDRHRPWVGSTNQRFHVLTDRYAARADSLAGLPDRVEVRVAVSGEVTVNGWATVDQLDALLADVTPTVGRGSVR